MLAKKLMESLQLSYYAGERGLEAEVNGIYIGDMMSWVLSHASKGNVWITVCNHVNIVAVACLTEISCIVLAEGIIPEVSTIARANLEAIPILGSSLNSVELVREIDKYFKRDK